MKRIDLDAIFNRFAGKEVAVIEFARERKLHSTGETVQTTGRIINENDPVIGEIRKTAADNGLGLRVWLPSTPDADGFNPYRLNVTVEKGADNKWRIGPQFDVG